MSREGALESVSNGLRLDGVDVAVDDKLIKLGDRSVGNELHRRRLHRSDELRLEVLSPHGHGVRIVVDRVDPDCRQVGVVDARDRRTSALSRQSSDDLVTSARVGRMIF